MITLPFFAAASMPPFRYAISAAIFADATPPMMPLPLFRFRRHVRFILPLFSFDGR